MCECYPVTSSDAAQLMMPNIMTFLIAKDSLMLLETKLDIFKIETKQECAEGKVLLSCWV